MSPDKQRIAIAEACGRKLFVLHKPIHYPFGYYRENAHGYTSSISEAWKVTAEVARKYTSGRLEDPDRVITEPAPLPDYLNDLNAMHAAEAGLLGHQMIRYQAVLSEVCPKNPHVSCWDIIHATAAQRAEAFLRTICKWEDDPQQQSPTHDDSQAK